MYKHSWEEMCLLHSLVCQSAPTPGHYLQIKNSTSLQSCGAAGSSASCYNPGWPAILGRKKLDTSVLSSWPRKTFSFFFFFNSKEEAARREIQLSRLVFFCFLFRSKGARRGRAQSADVVRQAGDQTKPCWISGLIWCHLHSSEIPVGTGWEQHSWRGSGASLVSFSPELCTVPTGLGLAPDQSCWEVFRAAQPQEPRKTMELHAEPGLGCSQHRDQS